MKNTEQQKTELKGLPEPQLIKEMQMPSGVYDQYLVLVELQRRKRINDDQARREAADNTKTVAQEVVNAAGVPQGGIAQLASAMNAKTDNTQNTGVKQMADGGVVKMQTAGKPPSVMSNILSLMNPYSVKNITDYNPTVAKEPEMTGLEAIETISPEVEAALEISRRAQEGEVNIDLINKLYGGAKKFADFLAGSIGILGYEGTRATLETVARFTPDINTRKDILRLADYVEGRRNDFIRDGTLAYTNAFMEQGMTKEEAKAAAEEKVKKEIEEKSLAAIAKSDTYDEFGDRPASFASLFAEGTPVEFLKGTPKNVPKTLPFGPKDSFDPFGDPARSRFTKGFPRNLDLVGNPMTDNLNKLLLSQNTDAVNVPPVSSESAVRPSVAEEISRLGRPIQTNLSAQPPAINPEGDSDDTLFSNVVSADEPFKLGGKALEEAEAKKAAQIKELLASETTPVPFKIGPAEMSKSSPIKPGRVVASNSSTYDFDPANQREATLAGVMPETEDMKQQVLSDILKSYEPKGPNEYLAPIPKYDEFGDLIQPPERIQGLNPRGKTIKELQSEMGLIGIPDYADAMRDLTGRAEQYYKDARAGRLDQRPKEVYGDLEALQIDPKFREEPPALQEYFRQILENQQKAMPGGGGRSGLGALFAQTIENQKKAMPGGTDPNAKPTLQSRFDRAKLYLEGLGQDISNMTQEDVIDLAKSLGMKAVDLFETGTDLAAEKIADFRTTRANQKASAAFDSDTLGVGSEPPNFKAIDKATAKQLAEEQDATDTASQTQIDKLMELLNKQQGAIDKQSGASSAALSKFLGGLEKDREFDKAMALANAGAALMMPSATIGEGFGKAIKAGTKTLQKGKDSYNKNKLQVLALQGRIDAAKAAAANRSAISGATLSSRILLKRREELADQLERLAPFGTEPKAEFADRVEELKRAIRETDDQLNSMIMTASLGSTGAGSNIFANYDLT